MIKYFIRHYWRYLAMALAFATISFLMNSCEVKAETSIQTESLNYNQTISNGAGRDFNIFSSSNTLKNYGRGVLQFTIMTYSFSTNTSHLNNSIAEITVTSTNSIFTCNIGNAINNYDQETNYDVNLYSVMCDVNLGSSGLQRIDVKMVFNLSNSYTLKTSQYMTFTGDVDLSIYNNLNTINGTLTSYLQSIYNNITSTNNHLSSLENIVNTDLTTIMNLMTSTRTAINNNTQAVNDVNSSINDSSTDDPTNDLNDMSQNEASNSVISDLLLLPINMFQNILNAVNGTCNSFNLGNLFNSNLTLPCINIQNYLGNSLYNVIDVIISGLFILSLRKKFIDIFENITSLKDRGNELE